MVLSRNYSDTQRRRPIQSEEFSPNRNVFCHPQTLPAKRLESYLLKNGITNPSIQKGFLSGVNPGTAEHIFTTIAIIDYAIQHGSPLVVTFLNLQNAFGSVAQFDHRHFYSYQTTRQTDHEYLQRLLQAHCVCETENPYLFKIKRGTFQGDTLSPVIFLTVFNPLIELSSRLTTSGFSLKVPVPNSVGLPPVNSATYVNWDENSDESAGWYYAVLKKHLSDGTTNIEYANKDTETINLHSVKWEPTKKGQKTVSP